MVSMSGSPASRSSPDPGPTSEEKRTLWVGGIPDQVDEEMIFELFLNVSQFALPVSKLTSQVSPI